MNLSRSDTYINVYIPREDGGDPRQYVSVNSPMFGQEKVYKFSDQVKKDRKLFLGKKQLSLYELYYKDQKGKPEVESKTTEHDHSDHSDNEDEDEIKHEHSSTTDPHAVESNVNKVSLSLDSQVKKLRKLRRFNEPLNSYVANKKKAVMMKRLDAEDNMDVERQATFDFLKEPNQKILDFKPRPQTFHAAIPEYRHTDYGSRERQYTFYNTRQKTFYGSIYRSQIPNKPKKPVSGFETKTSQSFGLPPIYLGSNTLQSSGLGETIAQTQNRTNVNALPLRPSSKPMKIYRQSSEVLLDKWTPKLSDTSKRFLAVQPPQNRTNVINLGQYPAF